MEVRVGDRMVRRHFDQVRRCPSQLEESHGEEPGHEPERTMDVPRGDAEAVTESVDEEPIMAASNRPSASRQEENPDVSLHEETDVPVEASSPAPRRSARERRPPSWFGDYQGGTK